MSFYYIIGMLSYQERQKLNQKGPFYIYHIPGIKIGVSNNPKFRIKVMQGYKHYEILEEVYDVIEVSDKEQTLQKLYGYKIDKALYYTIFNLTKAQNTPQAQLKKQQKRNTRNWNEVSKKRVANTDYELRTLNTNYSNHTFKQAHTPEAIAKRAKSKQKPIIQKKNGEFVKEWESIKQACINLKISCSNINKCLNHNGKTAGGWEWEYKK